MPCEHTGKHERWNGQAKSPCRHCDRGGDVIEGRIGDETGEGLAVVGKRGSRFEKDRRESMRAGVRGKAGESGFHRDSNRTQNQDGHRAGERV